MDHLGAILPVTVLEHVERVRGMQQTADGRAELARIEAEQAAEDRRLQDERAARERAVRFELAGCPKRIRELVLGGHAKDTPAVARLRSWSTTPGAWCLVLSGPKGVGKSVAAGLWLYESGVGAGAVVDGQQLGRWWPATEIATIDGYGPATLAVCRMPGPLVVDDLGCEYADAKGYFHQRLDRLIDWRYREMLPTVVTTNLSPTDFAKRYGERVMDRLHEGGSFFGAGGGSMRGDA